MELNIKLWFILHTTCELVWMGFLLHELHLFQKRPMRPMKLYYNNKITVYIVNNPVYHDGPITLKLIAILLERILKIKRLFTPFVRSHYQLTFIFSKPLAKA